MKEAFEKIRKNVRALSEQEFCKRRKQEECDKFVDCETCLIDSVIQIVSEVEAEYGNGWIPCSERLPENEDYVLCWYEYKIMGGTCDGELNQTYGVGWLFKRNKSWLVDSSIGINAHVVAWQPLPTPYKEGDHAKKN